MVFLSEGEACRYLEPEWVQESEGFAFSASGLQLQFGLGASGEAVVSGRAEHPEGSLIVLDWLRAHAQVLLESRSRQAERGQAILSRAEREGDLPESVEGLLAYIGFPKPSGPSWFFPGCLLLLGTIAALLAVLVAKSF